MPTSPLLSSCPQLDLAVVVVSAVVLIAESANARFLKALRVLRATRPLRVLTRSQSMLMVGLGMVGRAAKSLRCKCCANQPAWPPTQQPSHCFPAQVFHTLVRSLAEMANVTGTPS